MSKTINRTAQRQLAGLLDQAARALSGSLDPDSAAALVETLQQQAAELDAARAAEMEAHAGRTVSLKYAHQRLCYLSFLDGARIVVYAKLYYHDPITGVSEPVWAIYDNLQRIVLKSGETVVGLSPSTRLDRSR